jgi:hypothetical protein
LDILSTAVWREEAAEIEEKRRSLPAQTLTHAGWDFPTFPTTPPLGVQVIFFAGLSFSLSGKLNIILFP